MELELIKREAPVGNFALDILANEIGTNRHVVIENQLTETVKIYHVKMLGKCFVNPKFVYRFKLFESGAL